MTTDDANGSAAASSLPSTAASAVPVPVGTNERASLIAAHERRVDALRNSAQYRVGELVIAAARSRRRLLRLPVDAWRLRRELR